MNQETKQELFYFCFALKKKNFHKRKFEKFSKIVYNIYTKLRKKNKKLCEN